MTMKMILILQLLKNYFLLNEKDMEMLEIYMINLQNPFIYFMEEDLHIYYNRRIRNKILLTY